MTNSSAPIRTDAPGSDPPLDPERLDVYRLALEFHAVSSAPRLRGQAALQSQLDRASTSIVLNIAEGAGRRLPADKARFYGIARGSAMECAAAFDIIRLRGLAPMADCRAARTLLVRIVQMLSKLESSTLARRTQGDR
jgi:four helix bundle protein